MEVRHCPSCGSTSISRRFSSFEYGGSARWSCEDCDWYYKRGRGIGTGTGNAGTHPRKVDTSESVATGEYCSDCEVVVRNPHACTPTEILRNATDDVLEQEQVVDELDDFQSAPSKVLREAVKKGNVALTPTFYRVTEWPEDDEPELIDVVYDEIERGADEDSGVSYDELFDRLAVQNKIESEAVRKALRYLERHGRIVRRMRDGYRPRD